MSYISDTVNFIGLLSVFQKSDNLGCTQINYGWNKKLIREGKSPGSRRNLDWFLGINCAYSKEPDKDYVFKKPHPAKMILLNFRVPIDSVVKILLSESVKTKE